MCAVSENISKYLLLYRSLMMMSMMFLSSRLMISANCENLRCMASNAMDSVTLRVCLRSILSGLVEGEKLLPP